MRSSSSVSEAGLSPEELRAGHSVGKKIKWIALLLLCVMVLLALADGIYAIVKIQTWSHPEKIGWETSPAEVGLDYYTFELETPNGKISGWKIAAQTPMSDDADEWVYATEYSDKTVVFAPNYDSNREMADIGGLSYIADLCARGYNVFTFDWTGSGFSEGKKNFFLLDKSAELSAVVDYAKQESGSSFLSIQGVGFGCEPAARVAAEHKAVNALILDSTYADFSAYFFDSFSDWTAISIAPVKATVRALLPLFVGKDFQTASPANAIARLQGVPVLIIQGESDEVFGTDDAQRMVSLSLQNKNAATLWLAEGATHLRAYASLPEAYVSRVEQHLSDAYEGETA